MASNMAMAQAQQQEPGGSSNMYYNSQYNTGVYTNARYDDYYISFDDFYQNLAPYGQWINDPQLGYVWSPNVESDFRPYYTNGYWAMTEYGNTWVSDYEWGWACFHYGRWTYDSYYGWLWVPGTTWGPSWVSWRYANGYFGWAPLAPGFEFSNKPENMYSCPRDWWVFIPGRYIYGGNYYRFWAGSQGNNTVYTQSTPMDNSYMTGANTYVYGPRVQDVEGQTHSPVQVYKVNNSGSPRMASVHQGIIKLFRPTEVRAAGPNGERLAPATSVNAPRAITARPHSVSASGGLAPAFKTDVPPGRDPVPAYSAPIKKNSGPGSAQRADDFPYQSQLQTSDAKARQGEGMQPRQTGTLPPQRPQEQDPVHFQAHKNPPLPPPAQHPDPIPTSQPDPRTTPKPAPTQHPDPVEPSRR